MILLAHSTAAALGTCCCDGVESCFHARYIIDVEKGEFNLQCFGYKFNRDAKTAIRTAAQSQSAAIDIPEIKPPNTGTSTNSMRLTQNQRKPLIRQTHQMHDAKEAYISESNHHRPASTARCGTVGLVIGFSQMTPVAITAGKNRRRQD
jgi:hypothetical protein